MARPRRDPDREILIASDSGIWIAPDGTEFPFSKDRTLVRASHPMAKAMPQSFKSLRVHYDVEEVEQATAAPGERRAF